jgi:hypothetical protein
MCTVQCHAGAEAFSAASEQDLAVTTDAAGDNWQAAIASKHCQARHLVLRCSSDSWFSSSASGVTFSADLVDNWSFTVRPRLNMCILGLSSFVRFQSHQHTLFVTKSIIKSTSTQLQ